MIRIIVSLLLFASSAAAQTTAPAVKLTHTTQVLAQVVKESAKYSMAVSLDYKRIAVIIPDGKRFKMVLDGQTVATHDWFLPKMSGFMHGDTFWYAAQDGPEMFVVVNGEKQKSYFEIIPPVLVNKEKHVAYIARQKGGKQFLVVDGKEGAEFDRIDEARLHASGRVIYIGRRDGATVLVDGTTEYKTPARDTDQASTRMGGESNRVSWIYRAGHTQANVFVQVDDKTFGPYEGIASAPSFAKAGDRWAVTVKKDRKWSIVENGNVIATAESLSPPSYLADDVLSYSAKIDDHIALVMNGKTATTRPAKMGHSLLDLSADRTRWAWIGKDEATGEFFQIIDGEKQSPFKGVSTVVFSSDNRHFAYIGMTADQKMQVLVDGKVIHTIDRAQYVRDTLHFTPDGKHVVYLAVDGNDKQALYVDNARGPDVLSPMGGQFGIVFDDDRTIRYCTSDGDKLQILANLVKIEPN